MHEISLLENILDILQDNAKSQGFSQVKMVALEIGKLSCVDQNALRFGFDVVMKNTLAEQAVLEISFTEGLGWCQQCGTKVAMETIHDPCSLCGQTGMRIIQGRELKIKQLSVI